MIYIQETKKEIIDKTMCQAVWGDPEVAWEMQPTVNSAGGILCLWCEKKVKLERKVSGNGFMWLSGQWIKEAVQVNIVSIYSPCDIQNKKILWEAIKQLKSAIYGGLYYGGLQQH